MIRDRETANFCEEFAIKSSKEASPLYEDPIAKAKRILGYE
jgi:hypothetical protein